MIVTFSLKKGVRLILLRLVVLNYNWCGSGTFISLIHLHSPLAILQLLQNGLSQSRESWSATTVLLYFTMFVQQTDSLLTGSCVICKFSTCFYCERCQAVFVISIFQEMLQDVELSGMEQNTLKWCIVIRLRLLRQCWVLKSLIFFKTEITRSAACTINIARGYCFCTSLYFIFHFLY